MFNKDEQIYCLNIVTEKAMLPPLEEIFEKALEALREKHAYLPIDLKVLNGEKDLGPAGIQVDKLIDLVDLDGKRIRYYVEVKNNFTQANLGQILMKRDRLPGPLLLVANHINDAMADRLVKNKIEFMDAAGNIFIDRPPLFVLIKGNKDKDPYRMVRQWQAFQPAGLKVVFVFLCYPDLVNDNYRNIARTAGVALGNIGGIINDLKTQGFLLETGKNKYKLIETRRLLDRFIEEYPKKLRPQLFLGKFTGDRDWREKGNVHIKDALWGGEVAAADMDHYLKPRNATVYIKQERLNEFLLTNRLRKDPHGEVEVLKLFWEPVGPTGWKGLVPPALVYADLTATGDQRNIEAARMIYDKYLDGHIR